MPDRAEAVREVVIATNATGGSQTEVFVTNGGLIQTAGAGAHGVFAQSVGGGDVDTLVSIGTLSAYIWSAVVVIDGGRAIIE